MILAGTITRIKDCAPGNRVASHMQGVSFVDLVSTTNVPVTLQPYETDAPIGSFTDCAFENEPLEDGTAPSITVSGGGSVRLEDTKFVSTGAAFFCSFSAL